MWATGFLPASAGWRRRRLINEFGSSPSSLRQAMPAKKSAVIWSSPRTCSATSSTDVRAMAWPRRVVAVIRFDIGCRGRLAQAGLSSSEPASLPPRPRQGQDVYLIVVRHGRMTDSGATQSTLRQPVADSQRIRARRDGRMRTVPKQ
jgi:hypothetical protein